MRGATISDWVAGQTRQPAVPSLLRERLTICSSLELWEGEGPIALVRTKIQPKVMVGSRVVACLVSAVQARSAFSYLRTTVLPPARSVLRRSATSWAHSNPTVMGLHLPCHQARLDLIHRSGDPDTSPPPPCVGQMVVCMPCDPCVVWGRDLAWCFGTIEASILCVLTFFLPQMPSHRRLRAKSPNFRARHLWISFGALVPPRWQGGHSGML